MPMLRGSGHMLECIKQVEQRFPGSQIVQEQAQLWFLESASGERLSRSHNSHYACYVEALL